MDIKSALQIMFTFLCWGNNLPKTESYILVSVKDVFREDMEQNELVHGFRKQCCKSQDDARIRN